MFELGRSEDRRVPGAHLWWVGPTMVRAKLVRAALAALLVWLLWGSLAAGHDDPAISLVPPVQSMLLGSTASIDIQIDGVTNSGGLGGVDIALTFDPAVVEVATDAAHEPIISHDRFMASTGAALQCSNPVLDNPAGTVSFRCLTVSNPAGSGPRTDHPLTLASVSLRAVGVGTSVLSLAPSATRAWDPEGVELPVSLVSAAVSVQSPERQLEPTSTPPSAPTPVPNVTSSTTGEAGLSTPRAGSQATGDGGGSLPFTVLAVGGVIALAGILALATRYLRARERRPPSGGL